MIDENIEENLFSMLDEETDSEYVFLFAYNKLRQVRVFRV
jgi:hypothetical protein